MNDPLLAFADAIKAAGIPPSNKPFVVSRKIERFTPHGSHGEPGWYILFDLTHAVVGAFGDFSRVDKQMFCSANKSDLTPQQWNEVSKAWKEAERARKEEEERNKAKAREICAALFKLPRAGSHPYLKTKGVRIHGHLVYSDQTLTPGWLAIPLRDETGTIHSAQFIADDGAKRFLFGGRIQGCWHTISDASDGPICIAEGYATGASVYESTGWATFCAMNAGNLPAVAEAIRRLYPDRTILLAADNDQFTNGNPGITKATIAAKKVSGAVIYPVFSDESLASKPTDWNDLHLLSGVGEVKRQLVEGAKIGGDWDMLVSDACDVMTEVIPEPVEIVEDLVCESSKVIIGASSKSYKTWFSTDMAASISVGSQFLGHECLKRRVLYVNLELTDRSFKRRLQTIVKAKGIHFDYKEFFHITLRGRLIGTVRQIIDRIIKIARRLKAAVVVLDPIYKLNTQGKDENAAGEQTVFLNELDRLSTESESTLILVDHFGKGNQSEKDPLDAFRGSSVKGGDVDAALTLRKHSTAGSFTVDVVHRDLAPVDPFVITWQYPLFQPNNGLDPADMKKPKGGRPTKVDPLSILSAFEDTTPENGFNCSTLAKKIGMARTTLQGHLSELRAKSYLATNGEGPNAYQFITSKGRAKLQAAENAKI